jgi:hypothetical protein
MIGLKYIFEKILPYGYIYNKIRLINQCTWIIHRNYRIGSRSCFLLHQKDKIRIENQKTRPDPKVLALKLKDPMSLTF